MTFWNRHKEWLWLAILMIVVLVFALVMIYKSDFLANVGFLVLGALVSIFATLAADTIRRPAKARDLARALYEELADRVARCCFDCEQPWNRYLDSNNCVPGNMDSFRLRKFSPIPPIIYSSTAGQLAILENDAPQALIQFHFRLAAWQRDVENIAAESQQNKGGVAPDAVHFLATRVHQTLAPGLRALVALAPLVHDHEKIEAAAIAGYDETREGRVANGSLRERINKLLARNAT